MEGGYQLQENQQFNYGYYSSTCHERTPSGPGKSVRSLQVVARQRDGWAGGGR